MEASEGSLEVGDLAPLFRARTATDANAMFGNRAGGHTVLCFVGDHDEPSARGLLDGLAACRNDVLAGGLQLCAVSRRRPQEGIGTPPLGMIYWDATGAIAKAYRLSDTPCHDLVRRTFVLDAMLRIVAILPADRPEAHRAALADTLAELRRTGTIIGAGPGLAPVLTAPRIFDVELCRRVIAAFEADGGHESGFMQQAGDEVIPALNRGFKRRRDHYIADESIRASIRTALNRRLVPLVQRFFQFQATRMERYLVARYDSADSGFFAAHRDNTTAATAHRRFAVTINLDAESHIGGDLRFPEFGDRTYRAPTGGAVVFSCAMLHEALPVKQGVRYAFLPFLYDASGDATIAAGAGRLAGRTPPTGARSAPKEPARG